MPCAAPSSQAPAAAADRASTYEVISEPSAAGMPELHDIIAQGYYLSRLCHKAKLGMHLGADNAHMPIKQAQ